MPNALKAAQLADLIRDNVAAWISAEYPGSFVSVFDVTLTPDLQLATLWVRAFDERGKRAIASFRKREGELTRHLARSLQRRHALMVRIVDETGKEDLLPS